MSHTTHGEAAREAIARLSTDGLEPQELLHEAARHVMDVVPYDYGGLLTLDPEAMIPTSHQPLRISPVLCTDLLRSEVVTPDLLNFAEMSAKPFPVAALSTAESLAGVESNRRRDVLKPWGLEHEIRVIFRSEGAVWGGAILIRAADSKPFDVDERRFLGDIAIDIGQGLRRSLAKAADPVPSDTPPGVMVMDEDLRVVSTTPAAAQWRRLMPVEAAIAINTVALRAQSIPERAPHHSRVRLRTGAWLALHASPLHGEPDQPALTAVTLGAERARLIPLLLNLYGLSAREREVTELLLEGIALHEVAAQLGISRHSIRDHVKSVFTKIGVTSRAELMATLASDA